MSNFFKFIKSYFKRFIIYSIIALILLGISFNFRQYLLSLPRQNSTESSMLIYENTKNIEVKRVALETIVKINTTDSIPFLIDVYSSEKALRTDVIRSLAALNVSYDDIKRITSGEPLFGKLAILFKNISFLQYIIIILLLSLLISGVALLSIIYSAHSKLSAAEMQNNVNVSEYTFRFHLYKERFSLSFMLFTSLFLLGTSTYLIPKPVDYNSIRSYNNTSLLIDLAIKSRDRSAIPFLLGIVKNNKGENNQEERIKATYALSQISFSIFYYKDFYNLSTLTTQDLDDDKVMMATMKSLGQIFVNINTNVLIDSIDSLTEEKVYETFDLAKTIDPNNPYTYINHASYLMNKGKYDNAIKLLDDALLQQPDSADAIAGKAEAYFRKGAYEKSILGYNNALDIDDTNYAIYCKRGLVYFYNNDIDESITDFKRCINYDSSPVYYKYLGIAFNKKGDKKNANKYFKLHCDNTSSCDEDARK